MIAHQVHRLWSWVPAAGITLGRHVFLKDPADALTLAHELVHVRQQSEVGWKWWVAYLLLLPVGWNPWRTRWEAEAYAVQARAGCPVDGDNGLAQLLAGVSYGWCCRRSTASAAIRAAAEGAP